MSGELIELRAHRLPLAFRCAGSVQPAKVPIATDEQASRLGIAVHEALESLATTGQIAWSEVRAVAERHQVNPEEVSALCAAAQKVWPVLQSSFVDALAEVELATQIHTGVVLVGHADLLSVRGTAARVIDWKSGRKDHDYSQQMRGYAALVLLEDPELTEATATVVWLREQEFENYTMTRTQMEAWIDALVELVVHWDGTYRPGVHCRHCPRSHECEAANAMMRRDVAAIADHALAERAENELASMAPDEILALWHQADLVAYLAGRVRSAIKAHVGEHGDIVATGGARLTVETSERRELQPLAAWPVLEAAGLTSEELAACMELYVSRIESIVAKKAGRGKGAAAVRELATKLAEANAITTKETHTLKEKRS